MVRFSVPEMLRKQSRQGYRKACAALSRALGAGEGDGSLGLWPQSLVKAAGIRPLG
jgi:hypothetical protein